MKALSGRTKKCKVCPNRFVPDRLFQTWCSPDCAVVVAKAIQKKTRTVEIKAKRESIKRRSKWVAEAQAAFNKFIRERDHDLPCICCGSFGEDENWLKGGKWDAGHWKSVGAHPELRFEEDNCHKQLKSCNAGSSKYARKGRTVAAGYDAGILAKIGQARVDWLSGPHEPKNYTIEELKEIKTKYARMVRELKKQREST
jgi:hypothetical protein